MSLFHDQEPFREISTPVKRQNQHFLKVSRTCDKQSQNFRWNQNRNRLLLIFPISPNIRDISNNHNKSDWTTYRGFEGGSEEIFYFNPQNGFLKDKSSIFSNIYSFQSSPVIPGNQIYMAYKMSSDIHTKEKCDRNQFFAQFMTKVRFPSCRLKQTRLSFTKTSVTL